ncbi:hypothetical protein ACMYUL_07340 [Neisseria sp. CP9]
MQRAMWIVPQYKGRLKRQTAFQTTFLIKDGRRIDTRLPSALQRQLIE